MANPVEDQILAQEERLTSATQRLDLETLDRIYADDILFTCETGATCTKANLMDEARRGLAEREAAADTRHFVASYDKSDLKVAAHGDTDGVFARLARLFMEAAEDFVDAAADGVVEPPAREVGCHREPVSIAVSTRSGDIARNCSRLGARPTPVS